jgi:hypothetical protein
MVTMDLSVDTDQKLLCGTSSVQKISIGVRELFEVQLRYKLTPGGSDVSSGLGDLCHFGPCSPVLKTHRARWFLVKDFQLDSILLLECLRRSEAQDIQKVVRVLPCNVFEIELWDEPGHGPIPY